MGTKSMNYIAIQPGIEISKEFRHHLDEESNIVVYDPKGMGTLIIYESNFTPMHARDGQSPDTCCFDLHEEIAVHQFLCTLNPIQYRIVRAGDNYGSRGNWTNHPFTDNEEVKNIEAHYLSICSELHQRIRDLASIAFNEERKAPVQVEAEKAIFILIEKMVSDDTFAKINHYSTNATTQEMIAYALKTAGVYQ